MVAVVKIVEDLETENTSYEAVYLFADDAAAQAWHESQPLVDNISYAYCPVKEVNGHSRVPA